MTGCKAAEHSFETVSPILLVRVSAAGKSSVDAASPNRRSQNSFTLVSGPGARFFAASKSFDGTGSQSSLDGLLDFVL